MGKCPRDLCHERLAPSIIVVIVALSAQTSLSLPSAHPCVIQLCRGYVISSCQDQVVLCSCAGSSSPVELRIQKPGVWGGASLFICMSHQPTLSGPRPSLTMVPYLWGRREPPVCSTGKPVKISADPAGDLLLYNAEGNLACTILIAINNLGGSRAGKIREGPRKGPIRDSQG